MVYEENNTRVILMDENNAEIVVAPFDPTKKKKKTKKVTFGEGDKKLDTMISSADAENNMQDKEGARGDEQPQHSWVDTDRDYLYEELIGRVFNGLGERHRSLMKLPVPEVLRQGSKKTVHVNFMDFAKIFMEMELLANSRLDDRKQLVVNGRFAPKHFESILRRYAKEYVICRGCKNSNTIIARENRLMFLRCEQCEAARSVPAINMPVFRARIARRKGEA